MSDKPLFELPTRPATPRPAKADREPVSGNSQPQRPEFLGEDRPPEWPKDRPHKPIDLTPTERELRGFIHNLEHDARITDAWLAGYLADPTWVHPAYTAAVEAEIKRRAAGGQRHQDRGDAIKRLAGSIGRGPGPSEQSGQASPLAAARFRTRRNDDR